MTQIDSNSFVAALIASGINYAGSSPEFTTIEEAHRYVKGACLDTVRSGQKTVAEASGVYEAFLSKFMLGEDNLEGSVAFLRGCADASARRTYDGSDASVRNMNVHAENEFEEPLRGILAKQVSNGYLEVREAVQEYERFTVDYLGVTPVVGNLIECLADCVHANAEHVFAGTKASESKINKAMRVEFEGNVAQLVKDQKITGFKALSSATAFASGLGEVDSWTEKADKKAANKQGKIEQYNAENPDAPKVVDIGATKWLDNIKGDDEPSKSGFTLE